MATSIQTLLTRARIMARDTDKLLLTDPNALIIANSLLEEIYDIIKNVESNLVYAEADISAVDGTREYSTPDEFNGYMGDGVWHDGEDIFLQKVSEVAKVHYGTTENKPEVYYITEDNKVGLLATPGDSYTIHTQYWKMLTELTDLGDTMPWYGIWDKYFTERLAVEMLLIEERDVSGRAAIMSAAYNRAMTKTYQRGTRNLKRKTNFFVNGV